MLRKLEKNWCQVKTYPRILKRWKLFKMLASYPLMLVGLLFLIIPFFFSSNNFAVIVEANQSPLGKCQFNLDFTPGNEENAEVIISYRFHNPSEAQVSNLKHEFVLKAQYTNVNGKKVNTTLLKGETPEHAVLSGNFLRESYSSNFAEANTDFNRKACDQFYLERDRYETYNLYLDITFQFTILFEEDVWIRVQDIFLNVTSSDDNLQDSALNNHVSSPLEPRRTYKSSINAAAMLVFIGCFLTITTLKQKRLNPDGSKRKKKSFSAMIRNNRSRLKSLLYSSLLTAYFAYYRLQAIEQANEELVQVLAPQSFNNYITALSVSTAVLLISWFITFLPWIFSKQFRPDTAQNALKSLSISVLWLISAYFWSTAAVLSFNLSSTSVIRDRSISTWPSYAFLGINLIMRAVDLFLISWFTSTFKAQEKNAKRIDNRRSRKFLADADKMKENVFHAAYQLNAPRATYDAIKFRLESRSQPLEYDTGEKYQEEFLECLISERKLEKTLQQGTTIYRLNEQDIENDVQDNTSERDSEEPSKNSNLLELTNNILTAIEELNRPRASLNQLKHYFKKHSIPYKTKAGPSLDRDFINRLLVNLELSRKKITEDGNEYHVYLLTHKSLRFMEQRGLVSTTKDEFRQEQEQQRNLRRITLSNEAGTERDSSSLYDADTYICPHCKDYACRLDWEECPGCGTSLISDHVLSSESNIILPQPKEIGEGYLQQLKECPECGYHCQPNWQKCPECNQKFDTSKIKKISHLPENENEELDEIPEDLANVLGTDAMEFQPFIDPHLPNTHCRSCGKKQTIGYEYALCKECQAHFDPQEVVYCPRCGKARRTLRKPKVLKREKKAAFCLNCLQPFHAPNDKHRKYSDEGLFQKAHNLNLYLQFLAVFGVQLSFLIIVIFTFFPISPEFVANCIVFYSIGFLASLLLIRYRHASVRKERIARDPYYRTLIATKSHGRKRDSRSTKNRYKFKDPQVNSLLKKSYARRRLKKRLRYVFFPLLMMAFVSFQVYPAITLYLLIIAWSIGYFSIIHWDARLLEKAYRKGVQNGVSLKDYEMYVRQVNTTLSEEIR